MICYYRMCFIFILLTAVITGSLSFELYTENFLTAVRGRNISLPCTFSVSAHAVYWYKHASTGASDENSTVVASEFRGSTNPVPGFERFDLSDDYRLVIRDVSVPDETTYSCLVLPALELGELEERGYTDLRVIALGEIVIESCDITSSTSCNFAIGDDPPEGVTLVCKLHDIRPPTNLTWMTKDGRLLENSDYQTIEKDGLYYISSHLQVSESDFDYQYVCQAKGEAVNGTSSMTVTFDRKTGCHDWGIHGGYIFLIVVILAVVLTISAAIYCKLSGFPFLSRVAKSPRPAPLDNVESQPLNEEPGDKEREIAILKHQINTLMKERDEDRVRFEEEKVSMESNWKKELEAKTQSVEDVGRQIQNLQTRIKIQGNQELQMTTLKERDEERARFEEEKLSMESSRKKELEAKTQSVEDVGRQIQNLQTQIKIPEIQELKMERLKRKNEALMRKTYEEGARFEEEKISMESSWKEKLEAIIKGVADFECQLQVQIIYMRLQDLRMATLKPQKKDEEDYSRGRFGEEELSMELSLKDKLVDEVVAQSLEELEGHIQEKETQEIIQEQHMKITEGLILDAMMKKGDEMKASTEKGELLMENAFRSTQVRHVLLQAYFEDLKPVLIEQEQQLAEIKQQKNTLMRKKDKIIAILEENKLLVESGKKTWSDAMSQGIEGLKHLIMDLKNKIETIRFLPVQLLNQGGQCSWS